MHEFGPALRAAREAAGLSVEQVSARTRLRATVISALEAGDVRSSGGAVYARGHVRSVAGVLGVDPAPLLADLERVTGSPVAAVPAVETLRGPRAGALQVPRSERPERTAPRWGSAALAAVTVLVVLLGIGVASGGQDGRDRGLADPTPTAAEPPATTSAPPSPPTSPPTSPPAAAAPVPAVPARARLGIRAVAGDSWISVRAGDRTLFEGTVAQGTPPRDFSEPGELLLVVGNAGAVRLSCGGARVEPAGAPGQVRRFVCSPSGLAPV